MSMAAVAIFILMMFIVPLAVNEAGELAPGLAKCLVRWAAGRLGTPEARELYREDWLANLERVPGKVTKLLWALGLVFYGVPKLGWQIKRREQRRRAERTGRPAPGTSSPEPAVPAATGLRNPEGLPASQSGRRDFGRWTPEAERVSWLARQDRAQARGTSFPLPRRTPRNGPE
jgi:hypothetical protein